MNTLAETSSLRTLVDDLLEEQRRLTPVERFSRRFDRGERGGPSGRYVELIPTRSPRPGEQLAFHVDLDVCTGCKACVSACHSLNGLEESEMWRNVGIIHGRSDAAPYQQTVTTACHHCVEPGCLEGCPVLAYEKDESTGIVRHLDDQCIGCQYCVLKCPYDVPKYSERLGIVRKCDMCIGRLSAGEAPACVQACPTSAITIKIVERQAVVDSATTGVRMLPGAFESSYTKPTTTYATRRRLVDEARPADERRLRLEHAHWPLIWMLLLTQTAVGASAVSFAMLAADASTLVARLTATAAWLVLQAGLGVSVLHLGRPLGAWRFFLGLRTSWMSREILAFGMLASALSAVLAAAWFPPLQPFAAPAAGGALLLGLASVFTSVMIYVDTRRPFWALTLVAPKFFGATILLGSGFAGAFLACLTQGGIAAAGPWAFVAAVAATLCRVSLFVWEHFTSWRMSNDLEHPAHRSAVTITRLLPWVRPVRVALFAVSTIAGLAALAGGPIGAALAVVAFLSTFASQVIERYTFFTAVIAPRMPGGAA